MIVRQYLGVRVTLRLPYSDERFRNEDSEAGRGRGHGRGRVSRGKQVGRGGRSSYHSDIYSSYSDHDSDGGLDDNSNRQYRCVPSGSPEGACHASLGWAAAQVESMP